VILRRLIPDTRGVTVVEFAMVAPVLCLMLLAAFDVSHTLYTRATLQGIVQKTGRDFTLEDSASLQTQRDALDEKVTKQAKALVNNSTITVNRRYYRTFSQASAAQAEAWTDTNSNSKCDAGEPYQDGNHNSTWDADGGNAGVGGAKDAVVYTVTMSYPRMLPIRGFLGGSDTTKISAATVLRNQPYGEQGSYAAPVVRNCP
jgi:Flp pilus assembly protein TadG